MTTEQKINLRLSEVRSRLNAIAGVDTLTDEVRTESRALENEYSDLETRHRAAIIGSGGSPDQDKTGEGAEVRHLTRTARLGRYLSCAANGRVLDGAEAELRDAFGIADGVPWAALTPLETRADAATPSPSTLPRSQDEILARVFPMAATAFLGCDMPRVPAGETSYPVLTGGQTPATVAKDTLVESAAGTFAVLNLSPKRISARFTFRVEDAAVLRGMESALREDLADSMSDAIDLAVLTGDGTAPNVSGFLDSTSGSLSIPTAPSAESAYADYLATVGANIDGRYAHGAGDVKLLVGAATAGHMVSTLQSGSGMTAWDTVSKMSGGLRSSANIPAEDATSKVQLGIARRGNTRAAVCPIWEGVRIIRDEITSAGAGQVHLTAIGLYSFGFIRTAEYRVVSHKLG